MGPERDQQNEYEMSEHQRWCECTPVIHTSYNFLFSTIFMQQQKNYSELKSAKINIFLIGILHPK